MSHLIKKNTVVTSQENGISRFFEYAFPFQNASLGVSEINGRYPESGYDVDEEVEASWYVTSGKGTIWIAGERCEVEKGDMVHLMPGEKFWIDGHNLCLVVSSSPVWTPEQHKHLSK